VLCGVGFWECECRSAYKGCLRGMLCGCLCGGGVAVACVICWFPGCFLLFVEYMCAVRLCQVCVLFCYGVVDV